MPSVVYTGTFDGRVTGDGLRATASSDGGASVPSNAVITGIAYTLQVKSTKYSTAYKWRLHWFSVLEEGPSAPYTEAAMGSTSYTFSGNMSFKQSHLSLFSSDKISVYAKANNTHTSSTSHMYDFSITVEYELATLPELDEEHPANASVMPGETATLQVVISKDGYPKSYTYQWYKDGEPIDGATDNELVVTPAGIARYYCEVTNVAGTVTSRVAVVMYASGAALWIGGELVPVSAYIYIGDAWVRVNPYIYKDGAWCLCSGK